MAGRCAMQSFWRTMMLEFENTVRSPEEDNNGYGNTSEMCAEDVDQETLTRQGPTVRCGCLAAHGVASHGGVWRSPDARKRQARGPDDGARRRASFGFHA